LPMALMGWLVHWRRRGSARWWLESLAALSLIYLFWQLLLGPMAGRVLTLPKPLLLGMGALAAIALLAAALRWTRSVLWATPPIAAMSFVVVLHAAPKMSAESIARVAASGDLQRELALLDRYTSENQNVLRLLHIAHPDRVQESGTRSSERFVAAMAHLEQYT